MNFTQEVQDDIDDVVNNNSTELDLSELNMSNIQESIRELSNLERLYLINNELTTLPNWFSQLNQLKTL